MADNDYNNICNEDIIQINIKARINNSHEIIQILPYMLETGNRYKSFYTTCLTTFKKDSLKGQKNEKDTLSLYNAFKANKRYGVTSDAIKVFTNKDYLERVVAWLVQNDSEKSNSIGLLHTKLDDLIKMSNIPSKAQRHINHLKQLLKELIYSKNDLLKINNILNDLSNVDINEELQAAITDVKDEIDIILTSIQEHNKEHFDNNAENILSFLFPKNASFHFANKKYYIKDVNRVADFSITRTRKQKQQKKDNRTIFIRLSLVNTLEEIKSYGALDCKEQKRELNRKFNDIYGDLFGRYNLSYNSVRQALSGIGKIIDADTKSLKKQRKKRREQEKKEKHKQKLDSALINLLKGGKTRKPRKTRKHFKNKSFRRTRRTF